MRTMKKGRSKPKGGAFERRVCKRLSLWVTNGKKEDCFWRSAMSGGRATVGAKQGKDLRRQAGDICAVAPEGHVLTDKFFVECKHYADLKLTSFFLKQRGLLSRFWIKACLEAQKYGKAPLMIACENSVPIMVIANPDTLTLHVQKLHAAPCTIVESHLFSCEVYLFDDLMRRKFIR